MMKFIFKNVKIVHLLLVSFVVLVLMVLVVGGYGVRYLSNSNLSTQAIYSDGLVPVKIMSKIRINIAQISGDYKQMLYERKAVDSQSLSNEIDGLLKENDALVSQYESLSLTQAQRDQFALFKQAAADFAAVHQESIALIKQKNYYKPVLDSQKIAAAQKKAGELAAMISADGEQNADALKNDAATNFKKELWNLITLAAIALLVTIILSVFVPAVIVVPIKRLTKVANKVADGDIQASLRFQSKSELGTLAIASHVVSEKLFYLIKEAKALTDEASKGNFDVRADEGDLTGGFAEILQGFNNTLDTVVEKIHWYESLLDSIPIPINVTDSEMNWTFVNRSMANILGKSREELLGHPCSNWNSVICKNEQCGVAQLKMGRGGTQFTQFGRNLQISASYLTDRTGQQVGHIEMLRDVTKESRKAAYQLSEVQRLAMNLDKLAQGRLDFDFASLEADQYTIEDREQFGRINESLRAVRDNLSSYIGETAKVLGDIADGNLNVAIFGDYKGEFAQIKGSINRIADSLNEMMSKINRASNQVLSGASQVASASQTLSQGATEQASTIEELSAAIEDISGQIKRSAQNANTARDISSSAAKSLDEARQQMDNMVGAMSNINDSAQKISKIIKTIDEIAFQTNILALNAAVEAARAGEAGKGFAVVADEVRNLASKSADAAKDTAALIENSIGAVLQGTKLANATADTLFSVVEESKHSAELIGKISEATSAQALAIAQTTQAVNQISGVVQMNSATAEESAAASQEMSGQANVLNELVGHFDLRHTGEH